MIDSDIDKALENALDEQADPDDATRRIRDAHQFVTELPPLPPPEDKLAKLEQIAAVMGGQNPGYHWCYPLQWDADGGLRIVGGDSSKKEDPGGPGS